MLVVTSFLLSSPLNLTSVWDVQKAPGKAPPPLCGPWVGVIKDSSSGSTWFAETMNSIPGVECHHQVFTTKHVNMNTKTKQDLGVSIG